MIIVRLARCLLAGSFLWLVGCANHFPAADTLKKNSPVKQLSVPFITQDDAFCGPSAVAMVLAQEKTPIAVSQLAQEMLLPARGGTLQTELKASVRRHGHLAYETDPTLIAVLLEVNAGHPVIVLLNLSFSWYPKWHYGVVTGYDLSRQEIIVHSGNQANQHWTLTQFDNLWQRSGRWALMVLAPQESPPATAQERRYLQAVVDLEATSGTKQAEVSYQATLQRWPTNLTALIGLGNAAYQHHDLPLAQHWFELAVEYHPRSAVAANNYAQTLLDRNEAATAFVWAQKAVLAGGGAPARDTLQQALRALHAE
jgi:hypothetical protein